MNPSLSAIRCPSCSLSLKRNPALAGKRARCPKCGGTVCFPAAEMETARAPRPSSNVHDEDGSSGGGSDPNNIDFLAPPQAPDEIGRLGGFRVLRVLGVGGMGVVFAAEDPDLKRVIALKVMRPSGSDATDRERFLQEARAMASIEHEHVVAVHRVGSDRDVPFLAMPLLQGEPLDARLDREGRLPAPEAARIGREIADGLAAAHDKGLIHRDIKPANIWLEGRRHRVRVLDFGLARAAQQSAGLTKSGMIIGTPGYMSPEQTRGEPIDTRADLFALGCVLYRMLTGQPAFKGKNDVATLMAVALETPTDPREFEPSIPDGLADLVLQLLAKNPAERPASAHEVADLLMADAAVVPLTGVVGLRPADRAGDSKVSIQLAKQEPAEEPPSWIARRRSLVMALLAVAVSALLGVVLASLVLMW